MKRIYLICFCSMICFLMNSCSEEGRFKGRKTLNCNGIEINLEAYSLSGESAYLIFDGKKIKCEGYDDCMQKQIEIQRRCNQ